MGTVAGFLHGGVPGTRTERADRGAHGGAVGAMGTVAEKAPSACRHGGHRCGVDYGLPGSMCQLSFEGDGLRNAEHDAWFRGLPGAAGPMEEQPLATEVQPLV